MPDIEGRRLSRYRQIHCLIWSDDKFPFLEDKAKLVFFHLMTSYFSTPLGIFKASFSTLADEIHWTSYKYRRAFRQLPKEIVLYDERNHLIFLRNFLRYNPPTNANVLKGWARAYQELPACPLKAAWYLRLGEILKERKSAKELHQAYRQAFPQPSKALLQAVGTPEQEQEQEQEPLIVAHPMRDPNVKTFIDWFFTEWGERFGKKYEVDGPKDGAIVKKLLKSLSLDQLKAAALRMFDDEWAQEQGAPIGLLKSQINKWKLPKKSGPEDYKF